MRTLGWSLESWFARRAARGRGGAAVAGRPNRFLDTPAGSVRVFDSASAKPCVVLVPDGPNVIEHYEALIGLLARDLRVVCLDMPGFGFSVPAPSYRHSLAEGASAVLATLDQLEVGTATLAFGCANGFYALRAARMAPERVSGLFLAQTPSLPAMQAWARDVIPWPLRVPVVGQAVGWRSRRKAAQRWYDAPLPTATDREPFREIAEQALSRGACFCLAGVVQGLGREKAGALAGVKAPCTMVWGERDRSHRRTNPKALRDSVPHAEIIRFEDCGHFPDLEQPERFARLLLEHVAKHA